MAPGCMPSSLPSGWCPATSSGAGARPSPLCSSDPWRIRCRAWDGRSRFKNKRWLEAFGGDLNRDVRCSLLSSSGRRGGGGRRRHRARFSPREGSTGITCAASSGVTQQRRYAPLLSSAEAATSHRAASKEHGLHQPPGCEPHRRPFSLDTGRSSRPACAKWCVPGVCKVTGDGIQSSVEKMTSKDLIAFDFFFEVFFANFRANFEFSFSQGLMCKLYPPT